MKIQDYLHLYLGCEVSTNIGGTYVHPYGRSPINTIEADNLSTLLYDLDNFDNVYCKPILRPLSDMTEEEFNVWENGVTGDLVRGTSELIQEEARKTQYLLSKHFDLFGLIDAGLAIDKTKQVVGA